MKKINVAVIGTGNMGQHHVRIFSKLPQVNLVAVCDQQRERAQVLAKKYNCKSYQDYHEMIAQEQLDAISLAVPTFLHHAVSLEILKKKIPVLIEKPIATTLKEAKDIVLTSKKYKTFAMIGHIERFNPVVSALKKLIDKGTFGTIISLNTKRVGGIPAQVTSANVILDLAIHDIDISNYLLASIPKQTTAYTSRTIVKEQEDAAVIILRYQHAVSVIENNWITPVKIRALDITGSKAYAHLNYIDQTLSLWKNNFGNHMFTYTNYKEFIHQTSPKKMIQVKIQKAEPLQQELSYFIDCVQHKRQPQMDAQTGYNVLQIALGL